MSIFHYNPLFKKIIKTVKYGLATKVLDELFLSIDPTALYKLTTYKKLEGEYYLHPIPLHKGRLRERGFNQALLISRFFQKFVDVPILEVLERTKETTSQARISSLNERWQNLRGAFTLTKKDSIYNKDIILIDDVMTTGSTILSAAYTLKKNGARTVHALTLAHG